MADQNIRQWFLRTPNVSGWIVTEGNRVQACDMILNQLDKGKYLTVFKIGTHIDVIKGVVAYEPDWHLYLETMDKTEPVISVYNSVRGYEPDGASGGGNHGDRIVNVVYNDKTDESIPDMTVNDGCWHPIESAPDVLNRPVDLLVLHRPTWSLPPFDPSAWGLPLLNPWVTRVINARRSENGMYWVDENGVAIARTNKWESYISGNPTDTLVTHWRYPLTPDEEIAYKESQEALHAPYIPTTFRNDDMKFTEYLGEDTPYVACPSPSHHLELLHAIDDRRVIGVRWYDPIGERGCTGPSDASIDPPVSVNSELDLSKPTQTRDGRKVRIYADLTSTERRIHGAVLTEDGWNIASWNYDGAYSEMGVFSDWDLVNRESLPNTVRFFVNMYKTRAGHSIYAYEDEREATRKFSWYYGKPNLPHWSACAVPIELTLAESHRQSESDSPVTESDKPSEVVNNPTPCSEPSDNTLPTKIKAAYLNIDSMDIEVIILDNGRILINASDLLLALNLQQYDVYSHLILSGCERVEYCLSNGFMDHAYALESIMTAYSNATSDAWGRIMTNGAQMVHRMGYIVNRLAYLLLTNQPVIREG